MKVKLLRSSSAGNCTVLESGETVIVIDAGLSNKKINEYYGSVLKPDALFITHEHGDHISGAGILGRKTKCPVYMAEASQLALKSKKVTEKFFDGCNMLPINGGDEVQIKDFQVLAFSTKHDTAASLGFVIKDLNNNKKFGFLTDTGVVTPIIRAILKGCDAYFLECDYDTETLIKYAEYDDILKERIQSPIGHLSNQQALKYITEDIQLDKTAWIVLGHLSQRTNSPELLEEQYKKAIPEKYWDKIHIGNTQLELEL